VLLPRKTTSYKTWAEHLHALSADESLNQECEYWRGRQFLQAGSVPLDYPVSVEEANVWSTKRSVAANLDEEQTRALLELPEAEQGDVDSVLLTALARACTEWCGTDSVLVNLEAHGREELFADVDVSRTVGWFTSVYPVLLETMSAGPWKPARWLTSIQEQLRSVPNRGIGYGVLRYLSEDEETRRRLEAMPQPEISFNYLGQFDQVFRRSKLFAPAQEPSGKTIAGANRRQHLVDVQAMVIEGKLRVSWSYSDALHRAETMEKIAASFMEALRELLVDLRQHGAEECSPEDFPLTRLTHEDLMHVASLLDE
jgi:non-ribosomal peptide synthase protein (TIGR01720 family)